MDIILEHESNPLDGKTQRHFPVRHSHKVRRRTVNHIIRDTAKRYVKDGHYHSLCDDHFGYHCSDQEASAAEKKTLGHVQRDLRNVATHSEHVELARSYHIDGTQGRRARRWCRPRGPSLAEEESTNLARSDVPFPSDRDRSVRRPALEREDAFCDANTFKPHGVRTQGTGDDAEVAELYRMGLLYDEEDTKHTFNLNTIHRDDPVYTIRPAKRARRAHGKSHGFTISRPLNLDLSFADLGDDDAIARYLNASSATTPSEIAAAHDEAIQHLASQRSNSSSPPLRVIYELDSLQPSFDVDTSQPPGLMDDSLSDYDCFSDSDLDETPTQQREVRESGAADVWVMLD